MTWNLAATARRPQPTSGLSTKTKGLRGPRAPSPPAAEFEPFGFLGRWDSLIPFVGLALAMVGVAILLILIPWDAGARPVGAALVYGATLLASYVASSLYHWSQHPRARHIFRALDHSAIYLLIAGTVTTVAAMPLWDHRGALLLVLVWSSALGGIALRLFMVRRLHRFSSLIYVAIGWTGIAWIVPLVRTLDAWPLALLGIGGVAYTAGLAFFHWPRFKFNNAIWHIFVLAGSAMHFAAIVMMLRAY